MPESIRNRGGPLTGAVVSPPFFEQGQFVFTLHVMNAERMHPNPGEMDERRRTSGNKSSAAAVRAKIPQPSGSVLRKINCQKLLTSQHILAKVFRKDGPSLGFQFDRLPPSSRTPRRKGIRLHYFPPGFIIDVDS